MDLNNKKKKKSTNLLGKIKSNQKKYLLILSIGLLFLYLFKDNIILFMFYPIGIFLGYKSSLISKLVPFLSIETMTATTIMTGMLFGFWKGFIFGTVVGISCYTLAGWLKPTTIVNAVVISTGGIYAGILIQIFPPSYAFALALILRNLTGIIVFYSMMGGIDLDAISHAIFDPLFNLFFYMPIAVIIYSILI